jgi:carboxypeptidase C (cathepsin A)
LQYSALAGEISVRKGKPPVEGRIFYVAYVLEGKDLGDRPVTFAFNGGPGASSVWLHMGGLGPKRIVLSPDGTPLPPPFHYKDNPFTWLAFTDLVFIDPVGTGFSRSEEEEKEKKSAFFGVKQDIEIVGEFIQRYLTENRRWISPKLLVGESYGTTRAAGLAWHLHERYGIELNGLVLISPVLDFDTILFHPSNDLPYLLFLPTYAAAAWHHRVLADSLNKSELRDILADVEAFCLHEYPVFLTRGNRLQEQEKEGLSEQLSLFTGLPAELIKTHRFRISQRTFVKNLLRNQGLLVGRMDSTVTGPDPYPNRFDPRYDPSLDTLFGPFAHSINAYVRDTLKFETDRFYEFLNADVISQWDWCSGLPGGQGFVDVSHSLKDIMTLNSHMKVFIASGYYDLATPYFAVEHTLRHMWLGDLEANVTMKTYRAGHMIYTHSEALSRMVGDVERFYEEALRTAEQ